MSSRTRRSVVLVLEVLALVVIVIPVGEGGGKELHYKEMKLNKQTNETRRKANQPLREHNHIWYRWMR